MTKKNNAYVIHDLLDVSIRVILGDFAHKDCTTAVVFHVFGSRLYSSHRALWANFWNVETNSYNIQSKVKVEKSPG